MSRDLDLGSNYSQNNGRFLEAIIVCVDYSDFLEETLSNNINYFDNVVVVTSFDDVKTHKLCRYFNIDPVKTNVFYEEGHAFNKAKGINMGLAHLVHSDWVLHLDADILLAKNFRNAVFHNPLDRDSIYGADRYNVIGRNQYESLLKTPHFTNQYKHKFLVESPETLAQGARLVHKEFGYAPIGYFQLFHGSYLSKHQLKYPINQKNAERSDVLFALQWERHKRILLPNLNVFHLESEKAKQGTNWNGRKTKLF
jgi:hypothetical protein